MYKNAYLRIKYEGDKAWCRHGERLIADNFNNGTYWSVNLSNCNLMEGNKLRFDFEPLKAGYKIYFDKIPVPNTLGYATIESIKIEPEYDVMLNISDK